MKTRIKKNAILFSALILFLTGCAGQKPVMWIGSLEKGGISADKFSSYLQLAANNIASSYGLPFESIKDIDFSGTGETPEDEARKTAEDSILTAYAIRQLCRDNGIHDSFTEDELRKRIEEIDEAAGEKNGTYDYLKSVNINEKDYLEMMETGMLAELLTEKLAENEGIDEDYLRRQTINFARYQAIIINKTDENGALLEGAALAEKQAKFDELKSKLDAGGNFEELLQEYSEDEEGKANDLGYLAYSPEVNDNIVDYTALFTPYGEVAYIEEDYEAAFVALMTYEVESDEGYALIADAVKDRTYTKLLNDTLEKKIAETPYYVYEDRVAEIVYKA